MIGIYKITSPTKKVYIGQSINIKRRFVIYKGLHCKSQTILYRSFLKHGVKNHLFEILEQCEIHELNDKERYYQDLYSVLNGKGLNCKLTNSSDRNGKHSEETKIKIGIANKGRIYSSEIRKQMSLRNIGKKLSKEHVEKISLANKGKKISEEHRLKLVYFNTGKKYSEETKIKMSESEKGKKHSKETIEKRIISNTGKKRSEISKINISKGKMKLILNTENGIFYKGAEEASNSIGIKKHILSKMLCGYRKNKTSLIYV